jgi:hypothetical protein
VAGGELSAPELIQGLEAAVNLLILFGGALWFVLAALMLVAFKNGRMPA